MQVNRAAMEQAPAADVGGAAVDDTGGSECGVVARIHQRQSLAGGIFEGSTSWLNIYEQSLQLRLPRAYQLRFL